MDGSLEMAQNALVVYAVWLSGAAMWDDPGEYERYRTRVPALFPRLWRRGQS